MANWGAENLYKRVNGVVSFVAENPVRAIASPTQTWLSKWYREVRTFQYRPIDSPAQCLPLFRTLLYLSQRRTESGATRIANHPSATEP
jgi:hypothetical protein